MGDLSINTAVQIVFVCDHAYTHGHSACTEILYTYTHTTTAAIQAFEVTLRCLQKRSNQIFICISLLLQQSLYAIYVMSVIYLYCKISSLSLLSAISANKRSSCSIKRFYHYLDSTSCELKKKSFYIAIPSMEAFSFIYFFFRKNAYDIVF